MLSMAMLCHCGGSPTLISHRIAVRVPPDINGNSPVPVSFVTVTNPEFLKRIEKLPAEKWFEQRVQFHRDDPSGRQFTEWYWEFVPGNSPHIQQIDVSSNYVAMLVFANYRSPGDHRFVVPATRMIEIIMGEQDLTVTQLRSGAVQ